MIQTQLISSIRSEDVESVRNYLRVRPDLAKSTVDKYNPVSKETDQFPLVGHAYTRPTTEKIQAIRRLLLDLEAPINYQFPDGATLGHSDASIAAGTDDPRAYDALISWIQDGGDVSLKDETGRNPVQIIPRKVMGEAPGFAGTSAILLGLDKRNPFPSRMVENGECDNPDEIEEMTSETPSLFRKLEKRTLTLKDAYAKDTVAYRAFRDLLKENGANFNRILDNSSKSTLGHIFATEAANRNDQRRYLKLIRWIRDGGDVTIKDGLNCTPLERIVKAANTPQYQVPLPGLSATASILMHVKPDRPNDPAAKTDSRMPKYNRYPNKHFGGCKADRVSIPDTKEGLEMTLRTQHRERILSILAKKGERIEDIARPKHLDARAKVYRSEKEPSIEKPEENRQPLSFSSMEVDEHKSSSSSSSSSYEGLRGPLQAPPLQRRQSLVEEVRLKAEKEKLQKEIDQLHQQVEQLDAAKEQNGVLQMALDDMEEAQVDRQQQIEELRRLMGSKEAKVARMDASIKLLVEELNGLEEALICPITQEIMKDPVVSKISGITYERSAITEALGRKAECPITRMAMTSRDLVTNYSMKTIIQQYNEKMAKIRQRVVE